MSKNRSGENARKSREDRPVKVKRVRRDSKPRRARQRPTSLDTAYSPRTLWVVPLLVLSIFFVSTLLLVNIVAFALLDIPLHLSATTPVSLLVGIPAVLLLADLALFVMLARYALKGRSIISPVENLEIPDHRESVRGSPRLIKEAYSWHEAIPHNDALEYSDFVDKLKHLVLASANNTPLAISIEAPWGMGKTTAMHMLRKELHNARFELPGMDGKPLEWKCVTVWFNAWKYSDLDVTKGLLNRLYEAMPGNVYQRALALATMKDLSLVGMNAAGSSKGALLGDVIASRMDVEGRYRNQFEQDFRSILRTWSRQERAERVLLVIFVDDLDRCAPSDIASILEMMKLFFDVPGAAFVFGFDPEFVAASY